MPFSLTINGLDLSTYMRVHPEDGMDPHDPNVIAAGFGETGGEGAPLLSVQANNREMVFPLHIRGTDKQNLHDTLRGLHFTLSKASGKTLVLQDEGATNSTTFDVLHAQFDPDYNYRRSQRFWQSGVLRVWAKPYGYSSAAVTVASSVATGPAAAASCSPGGDVQAEIMMQVGGGSYISTFDLGFITGVSIVPSGYVYDIPIASVARLAGVASYQDRWALASHAVIDNNSVADYGQAVYSLRVDLSPATMYSGRNRIFILGRGAQGYGISAYNERNEILGDAVASSNSQFGHNTLDLGVLNVEPVPGQATVSIFLKYTGYENTPALVDRALWTTIETINTSFNRVLVLPDEKTALAVEDSSRAHEAMYYANADSPYTSFSGTAAGNPYTDFKGNEVYVALADSQGYFDSSEGVFASASRGAVATANVQSTNFVDSSNVQMEVFARNSQTASTGLFVGVNTTRGVRFHRSNGSQGVLALFAPTGTLLASAAFNAPTQYYAIGLRVVGNTAEAYIREVNTTGTYLARLTGAATVWQQAAAGLYITMMAGVGGGTTDRVTGWNIESIASVPLVARDKYVFDSKTQTAWQTSLASVFYRDITNKVRGLIPRPEPSLPQRVIGLRLPYGGDQRAADYVSVEHSYTERFRYFR